MPLSFCSAINAAIVRTLYAFVWLSDWCCPFYYIHTLFIEQNAFTLSPQMQPHSVIQRQILSVSALIIIFDAKCPMRDCTMCIRINIYNVVYIYVCMCNIICTEATVKACEHSNCTCINIMHSMRTMNTIKSNNCINDNARMRSKVRR